LDGRSDGLNLSINLIMVNFSSQQEDSEEMKKSIKTSQDARFYARFEPFSNDGQILVIPFTVKHKQKIDCAGRYIKQFPAELNQEDVHGESNITSCLDICGSGTKKVQVIFNYKRQEPLNQQRYQMQADWDQPEHFPGPDVKKPDDWDEEMDGEWEPLMISNLDYKDIGLDCGFEKEQCSGKNPYRNSGGRSQNSLGLWGEHPATGALLEFYKVQSALSPATILLYQLVQIEAEKKMKEVQED
ncbi:unnamed protein product, partial [Lepidochelys kempii]